MKIAAHLITVIHLCAIASNTVFNLAHLLAVACNAVVAAFSKLLQFGFAISIISNRIETMTEQQKLDISKLGKSCQQAEDALSQGMDKLQQMVLEFVAAGQLEEQTNTPNMSTAMERLEVPQTREAVQPPRLLFHHLSHDMSRQIETHHYCSRFNQDFLQCAVYDSDDTNARLLGVEYIISDRIFEDLPDEEKKLWHSHAYEVKLGLLISPSISEMIAMPELENLAKSYGKFRCTWQADRGDRFSLGALALMMSPQGVKPGLVRPDLVQILKYLNISINYQKDIYVFIIFIFQ
ncbi:hypothetical protein S83_055472 [Arachis hypogaea]